MKTRTIKLDHEPKFDPGQVVVTAGVIKKVDPNYAFAALGRHLMADWGLVDQEDWDQNNDALTSGEARLFSVYPLPDEAENFWIITEWDRSVTTILLPSEY